MSPAAPTVSLVTPCYNAARFVGRTVECLLAQTFTDWELVVVDDGSTDDPAAALAPHLAADPRVRLVRQPNGGVGRARNAGFRAGSPGSRYLLFLDADDCPRPEMLGRLVGYLEAHPQAGMAFCDFSRIDEEGRPLADPPLRNGPDSRYVPWGPGARRLPTDQPDTPFVAIFAQAVIIPSISLMRRTAFEQAGGWDEEFGHVFEDTDLFLRIALRTGVHYLPERLLDYRQHAGQSTASQEKLRRQQAKLYARWLAHPDLAPDQQQMVRRCWRFLNGRLWPLHGFRAGARSLARGELLAALRFWRGAAARYLLSLAGWLPNPATGTFS
jgi:glycosyltransferase involved in cell wall biosynthesis